MAYVAQLRAYGDAIKEWQRQYKEAVDSRNSAIIKLGESEFANTETYGDEIRQSINPPAPPAVPEALEEVGPLKWVYMDSTATVYYLRHLNDWKDAIDEWKQRFDP